MQKGYSTIILCSKSKTRWLNLLCIPYARHYNPQFVYFRAVIISRLFFFHLTFIKNPRVLIKSGSKSRAGYNGANTVINSWHWNHQKFVICKILFLRNFRSIRGIGTTKILYVVYDFFFTVAISY